MGGDVSFAEIMALRNTAGIAEMLKRTFTDFLATNPTDSPFTGAAISGGDYSTTAATPKHQGVYGFKTSANANSGYKISTGIWSVLIGGRVKSTIIYKTPAAAGFTNTTVRMGFHDSADQNAPVDGAYFKATGATLTGQTAKGGVISTTATNYILLPDTWYRMVVEANSDATLITFKLYADDSDTVLWSDTLNTNIPTAIDNMTSCGIIATNSGTTAGVIMGYVDYIDMVLPNTRRV